MNKILLILAFCLSFAYACTGDCISCHPVLKESINKPHHIILKTCIECHKDNAGPVNECGGDCFDCHPRQKLINSDRKEHQEIAKCKECHVDSKNLLAPKKELNNSNDLINILNK